LLRRWSRQFYAGMTPAEAHAVNGSSPEAFAAEDPDALEDRSDGVYRIAPEGVGRTRRSSIGEP